MELQRARKFERGDIGPASMVVTMKTDPRLVKPCVFLLKIFSIGITWRTERTARGTKLLAVVYRASLWTAVVLYALSRTAYFLSLLSYSGLIRLVTLDGLDDAAFIVCSFVLLTQSYSGLQLDERVNVLANDRRRRPFKSYVASSLFFGCLLFLLGSSSVLVVLSPVLEKDLPQPAPKFITTTEAPTTTKRSNIAAGAGGVPAEDLDGKLGAGGDSSRLRNGLGNPGIFGNGGPGGGLGASGVIDFDGRISIPVAGAGFGVGFASGTTAKESNPTGVFGKGGKLGGVDGAGSFSNFQNGLWLDKTEDGVIAGGGRNPLPGIHGAGAAAGAEGTPKDASLQNGASAGQRISFGEDGAGSSLDRREDDRLAEKRGGTPSSAKDGDPEKQLGGISGSHGRLGIGVETLLFEEKGSDAPGRESSDATYATGRDRNPGAVDPHHFGNPGGRHRSPIVKPDLGATTGHFSTRQKRELVTVPEEEVRNSTSRRVLDFLREGVGISTFVRYVLLRNFGLLSVAFSAALCWTVREQLRTLNEALDPSTTDREMPSEEVLGETRQMFLQSIVLCRSIDLLFRQLSLVWTLIVFVDVQLMLDLIYEMPSATGVVSVPPKVVILIHLTVLTVLHIFFTEGADRLRCEFGRTLHLVAVCTAGVPSEAVGLLEQAALLISAGTSSPAGLTFCSITPYSRSIGMGAFCASLVSRWYFWHI